MKKKVSPTSVRLDSELLEELDQRCGKLGCSRNDFIKNSVDCIINQSSEFDFGDDDEESKGEPKVIVENVPEDPIPMAHGKIFDDEGNLVGTF
jgi:predicted DNA-binding protein